MTTGLARRAARIKSFLVMSILARAQELERQGRDIVHMEIGEPDFPTPPLVVEAGLAAIRAGHVKYTPAGGLPALRERIAGYYYQRYGIRVSPGRIFVTPGASGGLLLALGLTLPPGKGVALADPGYPCYANLVSFLEGMPVPIPATEEMGFQLSAESIEQTDAASIAGVIIASPGNPAGTTIRREVLADLARYLAARNGFLISDEIYHGLEYGPQAVTALQVWDESIVVNGFSKYFGMTGWRVGWAVVPESMTDAAERLAQNLFISAPAHSQAAAQVSFEAENLNELERRRNELRARRDTLYEGLQALGFGLPAPPEGAFYILADCSRWTHDSSKLAADLLEVAGVAITPGADFGMVRSERYLRFSYAVSHERIAEGLTRLSDFLCSV